MFGCVLLVSVIVGAVMATTIINSNTMLSPSTHFAEILISVAVVLYYSLHSSCRKHLVSNTDPKCHCPPRESESPRISLSGDSTVLCILLTQILNYKMLKTIKLKFGFAPVI